MPHLQVFHSMFFFFFFKVELTYNVVLVSGVWHSALVIYIYSFTDSLPSQVITKC